MIGAVNTLALTSTLFLTGLLLIGLLFFIRASAKDRTQVSRLQAEQPEAVLIEQLQQYFSQRAYRIAAVDATQNQVTFEGLVRPSLFLAVFLTALAGIGILCLALVLSLLLPRWGSVFPGLTLLSPLAGLFYWKQSERREQVLLQIEPLPPTNDIDRPPLNLLTVTAHRDELAELQRALSLKPLETELG
jgi:hypothetical protein